MSANTVSYAMEQRHLEPEEQLSLIIIADACGELFTLDSAVEVVTHYTKLTEDQAKARFASLLTMGHILRSKQHIGGKPLFHVQGAEL